jgi:hypothetical protein
MVTLPTTTFYWRNVGDTDSSWTLDADGTFTPTAGQRVDVVAFGASLPAQITADTTPAISGLSNVAETANEAITAIDASGSATGTNLNYSLSGVSWLAIDAAGVITGNAPNENRTDSVTVTVSNAAGSASDSFDVTLTGATAPVAANWTGSLPALNAAYGAAVTVNTASSAAGDAPLSYSMSGAPVWLSINTSTGQITGTAPSSDVTTTATITVTNAHGSDSTTLNITVAAATLTYGNTTYPARTTASNAPAERKLALIGDSRVRGNSPGQFADEVVRACGEWLWVDVTDQGTLTDRNGDTYNTSYNYAFGGSSLWHAANKQAPAAVADGCKAFLVLTGTNGARQTGLDGDEGDYATDPDSFAARQFETLALLSTLDVVGGTIFLCNEVPGAASTPASSGSIKLAHHQWIDGLTAASAGLTNAELVIVDTWNSVVDQNGNEETVSAQIDPDLNLDWLHPHFRGQEAMGQAVWVAMNAHFGANVHLDFANPTQLLLDGATIRSLPRGDVPSAWNEFGTSTDNLSYTLTGTGDQTELVLSNSSASGTSLSTSLRVPLGGTTNAVVLIEYSRPSNDSYQNLQRRNSAGRYGIRNVDFGTGSNVSLFNSPANSEIGNSRDPELGGRRRLCFYVGQTGSNPRVDLLFEVDGGLPITFHRIDVYAR